MSNGGVWPYQYDEYYVEREDDFRSMASDEEEEAYARACLHS